MLILCVVSAEESSKARPLLAQSMQILLATAKAPLPESWDQTLDLPQVFTIIQIWIYKLLLCDTFYLHFAYSFRCVRFTLFKPFFVVQRWGLLSFILLQLLPSCHLLCSVLPPGPWEMLLYNYTVGDFDIYRHSNFYLCVLYDDKLKLNFQALCALECLVTVPAMKKMGVRGRGCPLLHSFSIIVSCSHSSWRN